jgi:uncharacterized protein (TIGR02118 family)
MIKVIVAIKRLQEMSPEEFQKHWRTQHAELVKNNPTSKKYIRKYIQCHTRLDEYKQGEVAYDGTAELWFDTVEDKDAFFSDPDYLKDIRPDEGRFADMTRTVFFVTEEEPVIGN